MKTVIKIDCENEAELLQHLTVIRNQVRRAIALQDNDIKKRVRLNDENCYGGHSVTITPES